MLCVLYVIAISSCLGVVGLLAERALPAHAARRWIWLGVVVLSVVIPAVYRFQHSATVHAMSLVRASAHDALLGRWLLATVWLSVFLAVSHVLRVWYVVRRARLGDTVVDGVPAVITSTVGPATVGILGASVVIPRWVLALPAAQRRYVMRHEAAHREAHDTLLLFVGSIAGLLLPWNLAIWWLLRRLSLAVEMDCDNRVVAALGDANAYGTMLLNVAAAAGRGDGLQPALLGAGMLEKRIAALTSAETRTTSMRMLAGFAAVALLVAVLLLPHPLAGH